MLQIEDLSTHFFTSDGVVRAVDNLSCHVAAGEALGIVGESGCGKSVTSLSVMRLVQSPPGRIVNGTIRLEGRDLLSLSEREMRAIRGNEISMIFQEPMTSLNPVLSIGSQLTETIRRHRAVTCEEAHRRAVEMLRLVQIPEPEQRMREYPHQLSGGMRQRVMIAIAFACDPKVLIADEPTTALDVTIQAQILALMSDLQKRLGTAVVLITHDLGVVAETCQRVIVMYAGRKVEEADVEDLFDRPLHPYTQGLMASMPHLHRGQSHGQRLKEIPGMVPSLLDPPPGCRFAGRCARATARCAAEEPPLVEREPRHFVACWYPGPEGEMTQ
jgi:oligopeptide/dipeptide ABC transporter, ATP-binding protein, C-terminal domain